MDPLQLAAGTYVGERWGELEWRKFGRDTGTSDIIASHDRLYRSLSFADPDYPEAALQVLGWVLSQAPDPGSGEKGRMELLAESMPDLPEWIKEHGPSRTKRVFADYLAPRSLREIPTEWSKLERHNVFDEAVQSETSETRSQFVPPAIPGPFQAAALSAFRQVTTPGPAPWATASPEPALAPAPSLEPETTAPRSIFIVHGHDLAAMNEVSRYVWQETGIMPTSLAEEAGQGQTIIEKFESFASRASYVIVMLTPDDIGQSVAEREEGKEPNARARQNVVLELGYFIGKIDRKNIVVLDKSVEHPSDIAGLSYIRYPDGNWKDSLRRELRAAGFTG